MGNVYIGDANSIARKIKCGYIGVDGIARKIKQIYVGDESGKARVAWQSVLDKVTSYLSVKKTSGCTIDTLHLTTTIYSGYIYHDLLTQSKNPNVIYFPCYFGYTDTISSREYKDYYIKKVTLDANENISSIKSIKVGYGIYGPNQNDTITFHCMFEIGNYLFCSYTYGSMSNEGPNRYMILCDMDQQEIVYSKKYAAWQYNEMDIKSGFAFNDTTAVVTYGIGCSIALLKLSGTEIVIKSNQYLKDPTGGYEIKYDDYFQVVKLSNTKGLIMGYYSGGDELVCACAFKLNDDNESLTFGTVVKFPYGIVCNTSNNSSLLPINNTNAVFCCEYDHGSSSRLYQIPTIVNDDLTVTFGTYYDEYSDWTHPFLFRKLASSTTSYGVRGNNCGFVTYEYDVVNAKIIYKGLLTPQNNPAGITGFRGTPISFKDNKMLAFDYIRYDDDVGYMDHHYELIPCIAEFK